MVTVNHVVFQYFVVITEAWLWRMMESSPLYLQKNVFSRHCSQIIHYPNALIFSHVAVCEFTGVAIVLMAMEIEIIADYIEYARLLFLWTGSFLECWSIVVK